MSTPTRSATPTDAHPVDTGVQHAHPSDAQYIRIAIILAIVTAIEVGLYYVELADMANIGLLMVLALIKFAMVAAFFMHLRFDSRLLRRLFLTGLVLATFCYVAVLLMMGVFIG